MSEWSLFNIQDITDPDQSNYLTITYTKHDLIFCLKQKHDLIFLIQTCMSLLTYNPLSEADD